MSYYILSLYEHFQEVYDKHCKFLCLLQKEIRVLYDLVNEDEKTGQFDKNNNLIEHRYLCFSLMFFF